MSRVRYETYCGGRLLKVFEQVDVRTLGDIADDRYVYVDGYWTWRIDDQEVAEDVAQAMLSAHTEGVAC